MISKMAVRLIIIMYGILLYSPFKLTSGVTSPPNNDCNNPNKLDALPLPVVRSSIAIENPKVATPVTGATNTINPFTCNLTCNDECNAYASKHPTEM